MAKSTKQSETKVTRITASDHQKSASRSKKANTAPKGISKAAESGTRSQPAEARNRNPFVAFWRYLKGSWYELRQVRWPDRRSTWGMTGALIAFTLFFVVVILLLDAGFSQLFKLLLGK